MAKIGESTNSTLVEGIERLGGIRATARETKASRGAVDQWVQDGEIYGLHHALRFVERAWEFSTPSEKLKYLHKLARNIPEPEPA